MFDGVGECVRGGGEGEGGDEMGAVRQASR